MIITASASSRFFWGRELGIVNRRARHAPARKRAEVPQNSALLHQPGFASGAAAFSAAFSAVFSDSKRRGARWSAALRRARYEGTRAARRRTAREAAEHDESCAAAARPPTIRGKRFASKKTNVFFCDNDAPALLSAVCGFSLSHTQK